MSYQRAIRFEEGETLIACSICGFPYLFPSEMTRTDDRLFRCKRTCLDSQTKRSNDRQQMQSQRRRDTIDPPLPGPGPGYQFGHDEPGTPFVLYDTANIDGSHNTTLTDGGLVSTWRNLGSLGAGADLTASGAARPTYRATGSAGKCRDLPSVQFTYGSSVMQTATQSAIAQPFTFSCVGIPIVNGADKIFFDGVGSGHEHQAAYSVGSGGLAMYAGAFNVGRLPADLKANKFICRFNGASSYSRVNNVNGTTATAGTNTFTGITLGGNSAGVPLFGGHIYGLAAWPSVTTPIDSDIEAYRDTRFGREWPQ